MGIRKNQKMIKEILNNVLDNFEYDIELSKIIEN